MSGAKRPDLDAEFAEFVAARKIVRCRTCKMEPELREWAEGSHRAGVPMERIVGFLVLKGHKMTPGAFRNHIQNHVG